MADMDQDKYLNMWMGHEEEEVAKIKFAQQASGAYYVDGSYRGLDGGGFEITPALRDERNGDLVAQRMFQGKDLFSLIDSISLYLRREIGITPSQMKQSIDLDLKDFVTDNFEALRYNALGIIGKGTVNYEKSIEQDSTYVYPYTIYAGLLHNSPRGQLEARHLMSRAMQYRKRLPYNMQMWTMLVDYQIKGEWDKAEKLINLQLELDPNNIDILQNAVSFFLLTGQLEKAHALLKQIYKRFPTLDHHWWLLRTALRKGEAEMVEIETKNYLRPTLRIYYYYNYLLTHTSISSNTMLPRKSLNRSSSSIQIRKSQ